MQIYTTYKVKIKHYHHIFKETVKVYRHVVDYLIDVCMEQWEELAKIQDQLNQQREVERLVHATKAWKGMVLGLSIRRKDHAL